MSQSTADPVVALNQAYGAFTQLIEPLTNEEAWRPSGCAGWTVRDLVYHCLTDAQRALVALHTPVEEAPDRDSASYWQDWAYEDEGADRGRRFTRVMASIYSQFGPIAELYAETAAAVRHAVDATDPTTVVSTQGHRLTVTDLAATLTVEVTVHHLDAVVALSPNVAGPSTAGLAQARRTLDDLLGRPAPAEWDDTRYLQIATGRAELSAEESAFLGADVSRLPLLG